MLHELENTPKVVGVKQSRRAIREGLARLVYLACDADPAITDPVAETCAAANVPVERVYTMAQDRKSTRLNSSHIH